MLVSKERSNRHIWPGVKRGRRDKEPATFGVCCRMQGTVLHHPYIITLRPFPPPPSIPPLTSSQLARAVIVV